MADIDVDTTYGGGRSTTTSRAPGLSVPAGGGMDTSGLADLLRRRFLERERERQAGLRGFGGDDTGLQMGAVRQRMASEPEPSRSREADPYEQKMKDLQYRDALARSEALTQPPPTRMIGGPGIIAGQTMDVMRMNPLQRQLFLPQASQMGPEMLPPPGLSRQAALRDAGATYGSAPPQPPRAIEAEEDPLQAYFRAFGSREALGLAQQRQARR